MSRITELVREIKVQAHNYYSGNQQISDVEFDSLVYELYNLDPDNEILYSVGYGFYEDDHESYPHLRPLVGLPKEKVTVTHPLNSTETDKVATSKLDGGSVELIYSKGKLVTALTRGNGLSGRKVLDKLCYAQGVPIELKGNLSNYSGNIIGEYVLSEEDSLVLGVSDYSRNIPNGFLGRKEVKYEESSLFAFIAYRITLLDSESISKEVLDNLGNYKFILDLLGDGGFISSKYLVLDKQKEVKYEDAYDSLRLIDNKNYLSDGIVTCDNLIELDKDKNFIKLNYTNSLAYKTITETSYTKVKSIEWRLTRTQKLVPTLTVDPVELSGATISKVLAHNYKYISDNNIGVNTEIEIVRSGEVIPYILDVRRDTGEDFSAPDKCPSCNSELSLSGVDLVCTNPNCNNKSYEMLYRWITTFASVKGLGPKGVNQIISSSEANSVSDLYSSKVVGNLSKYAKMSYDKLLSNTKINITDLFYALNVKSLGYSSITKLLKENKITKNDLTSNSLVTKIENSRLTESAKNDLILAIESANFKELFNYIEVLDNEIDDKSDKISENDTRLKVCITGSLNNLTKAEFYKEYENLVVESDIKNCDYLIANSGKKSSKLLKAEKLGKCIVSEVEFLGIINRA